MSFVLFKQGKILKAEEYCRKGIKLYPSFNPLYAGLSYLLQQQGKVEESVKWGRRNIMISMSMNN